MTNNEKQENVPAEEKEKEKNDHLIFGLLREIRASTQCLQKLIKETLEKASKLDASARTALMSRFLAGKMLPRIDEKIKSNLKKIDQLFENDVNELDWCSDYVESIRLNWLQVSDLWPNASIVDYDEQRQRLDQVNVYLDQIIYYCASLTLSPRVSEVLKNLRVGQPLDWDFAFGSELPTDLGLNKRLLQELAQEGGVLESAVVDVDQRLIYKVAKTRAEQRHSAYWQAAFIVVCGIGVPLILSWVVPWMLSTIGKPTEKWPLGRGDLARLYVTYIFIFIGSGAHVAIEALKVARAQTRPSFQAMNDWILWLHVHNTSILWSLAWILLGYVLLSMGMKLEGLSAFFAGYSIDSVTALFLARFETTVKTKTKEFTGESNKLEPEK